MYSEAFALLEPSAFCSKTSRSTETIPSGSASSVIEQIAKDLALLVEHGDQLIVVEHRRFIEVLLKAKCEVVWNDDPNWLAVFVGVRSGFALINGDELLDSCHDADAISRCRDASATFQVFANFLQPCFQLGHVFGGSFSFSGVGAGSAKQILLTEIQLKSFFVFSGQFYLTLECKICPRNKGQDANGHNDRENEIFLDKTHGV